MRTVSIQTIADRAAVSRSTAGLVLNGRGDQLGIRKDTQERIKAIARQMRYKPNYLARGLVGKSTQTIGVLATFPLYEPYQKLRREWTIQLQERGYQAFVTDTLNEKSRILRELDELARRRVDGLILRLDRRFLDQAGIVQALQQFEHKVLIVDSSSDEPVGESFPVVRLVRRPGIRELIDHWVAQGRQRIGLIVRARQTNHELGVLFRSELRRHGRRIAPGTVLSLDKMPEKDFEDRVDLFAAGLASAGFRPARFDALLVSADEGAAEVMRLCHEHDLRVPEDVAIAGFNNTSFCKVMSPPLASIDWNIPQIVTQSIDMLFSQLQGQAVEPLEREVSAAFHWRASAG